MGGMPMEAGEGGKEGEMERGRKGGEGEGESEGGREIEGGMRMCEREVHRKVGRHRRSQDFCLGGAPGRRDPACISRAHV